MPDWKPNWPFPFGAEGEASADRAEEPSDARRRELETELHQIDADIGKLREEMLLLRGLGRTPEQQARIDALEQQYEDLAARFVEAYRAWNALE